ncbi:MULTISPECIES: zinc-binding dehydrogenase [unclassified Streptomyces]|uniref:zinc-binding dehydrogenase n=1 Tax=unclassified Streptomyces TaxID=2593676 RepID=UPI0036ED33B6
MQLGTRASGWCVQTATAPPPRENGDVQRRPFPAEPSLVASPTAVTRRSLIATTAAAGGELEGPSERHEGEGDAHQAAGSAAASSAYVLRELAALIADGELEIPVAGVYRLDEVRAAFRELERRHTNGRIVLRP